MGIPKIIEFQTITACNAACTVCPWPQVRGGGKPLNMSIEVWNKLLKDLREINPYKVIPYLNNEPLTDKKIEYKIREIHKELNSPEIELSTNASLLTKSRAYSIFESGITELYISIFGYDNQSQTIIMNLDYQTIRKNVLDAILIKKQLRLDTKIIIIQIESPYVDKELLNKERIYWEDFGVEVRRYGYLDRAGNIYSNDYQRDCFQIPHGCELNRHKERMYVLTDGTVLFCCHDWRIKFPMGNILESSLLEIWNSHNYKLTRQMVEGEIDSNLNFICRKCKLSPYKT
jgi:radical SAM protein with 4Fe4S-binding SPASM domain